MGSNIRTSHPYPTSYKLKDIMTQATGYKPKKQI